MLALANFDPCAGDRCVLERIVNDLAWGDIFDACRWTDDQAVGQRRLGQCFDVILHYIVFAFECGE